MKTLFKFSFVIAFVLLSNLAWSQEIRTLFSQDSTRSSGGYGAVSNKFTTIRGSFANMTSIYGGWYINHKFTLGVSGASLTNNMLVPEQYRAQPSIASSYQYVQFGLFTEYVIASDRLVHVTAQLFAGPGLTGQYERFDFDDFDQYDEDHDFDVRDVNWFTVVEPGINVEVNLLKWMRLCTGVSYRAVFNSEGLGLGDKDLSGAAVNVGFKFGKF